MNLKEEYPKVKSVPTSRISFDNHNNVVFNEMKISVKSYFANVKKEGTGNLGLYIKAVFFIAGFLASYVMVVFFAPPVWLAIILCASMGILAAGIGFNLMHDGAHGSFSDKKWINVMAAYSINILGGDAVLWKNKHNLIHHTYTNIEGHDQDIAQLPILRSNHLQKKYSLHKYQHIYALFVYGLSSLLWVFVLDFIKYFKGKVGNFKIANMNKNDHLIFWITKIAYFLLYLALPALFWGWAATLVGFFIFHFFLGVILSTVFQLAHVVETTEFTEHHLINQKIEDEWAIHQLKTTANFATNNKLITWYVGGLNFQVEHHLFPKISHVHYPILNKIIKKVCREQNVVYNEFPTFLSALQSHINYLKKTGAAC